jgi:hypothetical protein
MARMLRVIAIALVASSAACVGNCGGGMPSSDTCRNPDPSAAVSALEIGTFVDGHFTPIADGDVLRRVFGPQGGAMFDLRLELEGQVPSCLAQDTRAISAVGQVVASETAPIETAPSADGRHLTGSILLVLHWGVEEGHLLRLVARAGGAEVERTVYVERIGPVDAGAADATAADASAPDAAAPDAPTPEDAAPEDAHAEDAHAEDAAPDAG